MITIKDEPLSVNGIRIHMICFDTAKSVFQLALVPAIVAMAVKAVESGKDIAGPVSLDDSVKALHTVSCDPSVSAKLPLKRGGVTTALEIHEHYIDEVNKYLNGTETPGWVKRMLELWCEIVANLRKDPFLEINRLDWVAKLVVFTQILERLGLTWGEYSKWLYVLASVRRLKVTWPALDPLRLTESGTARVGIRRSALGVLEQ